MCEAVEEYARERAEREAEKYVRNLFRNGVSIEIVSASIVNLTQEKIQKIYNRVMKEKSKELA